MACVCSGSSTVYLPLYIDHLRTHTYVRLGTNWALGGHQIFLLENHTHIYPLPRLHNTRPWLREVKATFGLGFLQ